MKEYRAERFTNFVSVENKKRMGAVNFNDVADLAAWIRAMNPYGVCNGDLGKIIKQHQLAALDCVEHVSRRNSTVPTVQDVIAEIARQKAVECNCQSNLPHEDRQTQIT